MLVQYSPFQDSPKAQCLLCLKNPRTLLSLQMKCYWSSLQQVRVCATEYLISKRGIEALETLRCNRICRLCRTFEEDIIWMHHMIDDCKLSNIKAIAHKHDLCLVRIYVSYEYMIRESRDIPVWWTCIMEVPLTQTKLSVYKECVHSFGKTCEISEVH